MEFTNDIFFNKKLTQNETILITYSGKLYKEYSAEITIVYGFGENWDYTQETKMQEKENGFEAAITMKNYNTFNFCFKNNFNIWDNNSGFNYIASIESAQTDETINQDQVVSSENNTSKVLEEKEILEINEEEKEILETNEEEKEILETNEEEKEILEINEEEKEILEINEEEKQAYIDKAFDELLNSIMDFEEEKINENVNLEDGFGFQSIEKIKETDFISCDDIFQEMFNELAKIESNPEKSSIQTISTEDIQNKNSQLETLLSDFSEKQEQKILITSEELNELMDNILNSIIEENSNESNNNIKLENEISGLPAKQQTSSLENTIDNWIDSAYAFIRNMWTGIKKIGTLIKQKAQELLGEEDK